MKKINTLKALVIAIPIATAIFAQHLENKSNKRSIERFEKIEKSENQAKIIQ